MLFIFPKRKKRSRNLQSLVACVHLRFVCAFHLKTKNSLVVRKGSSQCEYL